MPINQELAGEGAIALAVQDATSRLVVAAPRIARIEQWTGPRIARGGASRSCVTVPRRRRAERCWQERARPCREHVHV
jgi:hypothetical protein